MVSCSFAMISWLYLHRSVNCRRSSNDLDARVHWSRCEYQLCAKLSDWFYSRCYGAWRHHVGHGVWQPSRGKYEVYWQKLQLIPMATFDKIKLIHSSSIYHSEITHCVLMWICIIFRHGVLLAATVAPYVHVGALCSAEVIRSCLPSMVWLLTMSCNFKPCLPTVGFIEY